MDVISIGYIVIAALVGAAITFVVCRRHASSSQDEVNDADNSELNLLQKKYDEVRTKLDNAQKEANSKIEEANEQLQKALNGNVDEAIKTKLAEVDKLKKKLSDLQDELDEKEDDIDDIEKKLKKKTAENGELQESIDKSNRELKKISSDYEQAKSDLEEKGKDLDLKKESLTFVQEILTAKTVSDKTTQNLLNKIDSFVEFVLDDVNKSVKSCYDLKEELENDLFGSKLTEWAITQKKSWIQGKTTIALVGEFSAGKTSIVNRLLSQDNPNVPLLPVSTKATTAIPTYISGSQVKTLFKFVSPDNEQKEISEATFRRVNKEVLDQVQGVSSLIKYFVMSYVNPNLQNLSILDTPGFNSNDKEDAERTIDVINECDALFWVVDVNAGTVNRASIKLIKDNLKSPLFVVINKVDTKAKSEVDKVENLIKNTMESEGLHIEGYLRFSSKEQLDTLLTPIKSIQHDIAKDEYLTFLCNTLGSFVKELETETKKAKKVCTKLENESNALVDNYNSAMGALSEDCVSVSEIPHWEEHLFSKDRYEMSADEFEAMTDLLSTIAEERCNDLADLYNKQMEKRAELSDAYEDYENNKAMFQNLNRCYESLQNKIKDLK